MDHERMVKCGVPTFQLDRDRRKARMLFRRQHRLDRVHGSCQPSSRQEVPPVTARNILQAPVLARGVVERDPARQVRHRFGTCPVRIILMPRHHTAVTRRLAEQLVVPEANRTIEQLRCRNDEGRVPQQVVEGRRDAPRTERVKEHLRRVGGLVGVKLVEKRVLRVSRIGKCRQVRTQSVDLGIRE